MDSLIQRQLSHTVFWNISLRACVPNFKVPGHSLQMLELLEWSSPKKFYETYTAKRSSLIYNTIARHEQHECDTSDTNAKREQL